MNTKTEAQLKTEGWKLASISTGSYLERMLDTYKELGVVIYLQEVKPEECGQCTECYKEGTQALYKL